jgi:hypothetical protein
MNTYLTKYGKNADFWTFCNHGEGIGWSRRAAEVLNIERFFIFYFFGKKMKNPKNIKIDYISAARQVNLPRSCIYFWTLVCP